MVEKENSNAFGRLWLALILTFSALSIAAFTVLISGSLGAGVVEALGADQIRRTGKLSSILVAIFTVVFIVSSVRRNSLLIGVAGVVGIAAMAAFAFISPPEDRTRLARAALSGDTGDVDGGAPNASAKAESESCVFNYDEFYRNKAEPIRLEDSAEAFWNARPLDAKFYEDDACSFRYAGFKITNHKARWIVVDAYGAPTGSEGEAPNSIETTLQIIPVIDGKIDRYNVFVDDWPGRAPNGARISEVVPAGDYLIFLEDRRYINEESDRLPARVEIRPFSEAALVADGVPKLSAGTSQEAVIDFGDRRGNAFESSVRIVQLNVPAASQNGASCALVSAFSNSNFDPKISIFYTGEPHPLVQNDDAPDFVPLGNANKLSAFAAFETDKVSSTFQKPNAPGGRYFAVVEPLYQPERREKGNVVKVELKVAESIAPGGDCGDEQFLRSWFLARGME